MHDLMLWLSLWSNSIEVLIEVPLGLLMQHTHVAFRTSLPRPDSTPPHSPRHSMAAYLVDHFFECGFNLFGVHGESGQVDICVGGRWVATMHIVTLVDYKVSRMCLLQRRGALNHGFCTDISCNGVLT
jgi:hypothetical protein